MDEKDFREKYKELFDGIKAGEELKDKILRQKNPKRKFFRPIVTAIATTAAAVLIFAAVHDYSFDRDDSGVIKTVTVSETEPPEQKNQSGQTSDSVAEHTESQTREVRSSQKTADNKESDPSSGSGNPTTHAPSIVTPKPRTAPQRNAEEANKAAPASGASGSKPLPKAPESKPESETPGSDTAENTSESDTSAALQVKEPDDTVGGSLVLPFRTGTVTLRMSAESVLTDIILQSMQQSEEPDNIEEYHTEQWNNEKYFNYIGNDILNNISLGSDMTYVGEDHGYFTVSSTGKLKDDHRIFVFKGSGRRSASILTSRDTGFVDTVLSSPEIDKKTFSDIEMTAFGADLTYFFYIKSNDIAYIVTTEGLNGEEIAELISSINE